MIELSEITKVFRSDEIETSALSKINLEVKQGEFIAIMGPSGCGKSTLLNIIGILDDPTSGSYTFNGTDVLKLKEGKRSDLRKENIGFIFQNFNLINELNVYDNIELPLIYQKIKSSERKIMVNRALDQLKIGHRKYHYSRQLSGGQQQRVAIARAIVNNPRLILADEPTGNLDSKNGIEVMKILSDLNQNGSTILIVTHSDRDAGFSHRIINLFDGMIVAEKSQRKIEDNIINQ
jgi:putative ABC transport system ATP-binding protein